MPPSPLLDMVAWSHRLLAEVLRPGDLALDLTAGHGRDTLFLSRQVGRDGRVVAFDLQERALEETECRLHEAGIPTHRGEAPAGSSPGVWLAASCHSRLQGWVGEPVRAVIANLGYLPGGDRLLPTRTRTTLAAVEQSLNLLQPGGRLVLVVYTGHPGGAEEGEALEGRLARLAGASWDVLVLKGGNRVGAPYLLAAERRLER